MGSTSVLFLEAKPEGDFRGRLGAGAFETSVEEYDLREIAFDCGTVEQPVDSVNSGEIYHWSYSYIQQNIDLFV